MKVIQIQEYVTHPLSHYLSLACHKQEMLMVVKMTKLKISQMRMVTKMGEFSGDDDDDDRKMIPVFGISYNSFWPKCTMGDLICKH